MHLEYCIFFFCLFYLFFQLIILSNYFIYVCTLYTKHTHIYIYLKKKQQKNNYHSYVNVLSIIIIIIII